jgi:hypothetical protein
MGGTTLFRPLIRSSTPVIDKTGTFRSYVRAYGMDVDVRYFHGRETVTEMHRLATRNNGRDTPLVTPWCDKTINNHASVHTGTAAAVLDRDAQNNGQMVASASATDSGGDRAPDGLLLVSRL